MIQKNLHMNFKWSWEEKRQKGGQTECGEEQAGH